MNKEIATPQDIEKIDRKIRDILWKERRVNQVAKDIYNLIKECVNKFEKL